MPAEKPTRGECEPDTARVYERAKPQKEIGIGELTATPTRDDKNPDAAKTTARGETQERKTNPPPGHGG